MLLYKIFPLFRSYFLVLFVNTPNALLSTKHWFFAIKRNFYSAFQVKVGRRQLFFWSFLSASFYQLFSEISFWSTDWEVAWQHFSKEGRTNTGL